MADLRKLSSASNLVRFTLKNSSTGAPLTGLTGSSSGLIISTIADNEASATTYTQAASHIQTIAALGTFAAPSASNCRFGEVDATNHPGLYEFQFADARFAVSSAKRLVISVSGAASLLATDYEIQLTSVDVYSATAFITGVNSLAPPSNWNLEVIDASGRVDVSKIGGTAQTARDLGTSVLLSSGTGTGQLDFTSGVVKANLAQILGTALTETAGQIAAAFKKFFDKATPTGTVNSLPDAVAGASSGLALVGSNVGAATSVSGSVGSIASGGISAASIAADAITAAKIADGAIDAATFAAGAINAAAIATDAITAAKIAADAIGASELAADAVTEIQSGLATPTNITAGTITTVTNLTNAPTAGDFTATMKTSLNAATPASVQNISAQTGDSYARLGAPAGASHAADTAAVLAKTPDAAHFTNARGDLLANLDEAVSAILTTAMTESYPADGATMSGAQALYLLRSFLTDFSISGVTLTARKIDGSTTSSTYTLNDATSPTGITRAS